MGLNQETHQLPGPSQEYLTGDQLAALLQVSAKSISRWASSDPSMPVLRIGRTVRFPKERVLRWLRAREQGIGRHKQSEKLLPSPSQPLERVEKAHAI
jgi:excisionase family DNA binding protein